MVGVDVVEVVVRRQWVWLSRPWQDMRDNLSLPRKGDNGAAAVAAERVGLGDNPIQSSSDRDAVQPRQYRIRRGALTVAGDDDGDLLSGQAPLGRRPATLACLPWQPRALALERFQNEGLVALNNARQRLRLVGRQCGEEPVPPAECGGVVHTAAPRRFGKADAVDHRPGLLAPLLAHAQLCQRRLGQGVEGAGTGLAAIAR